MISVQNATSLLVVFRAYLASDHVTPATGKTIAITISKNGATSFSNPNAGALNATEMASGWYKAALDTTDTGTNGPLAVRGAEAAIDDVGVLYYVEAPRKVDVDTIKTNPVANGGTVTFPTNSTLASTANITAATGVTLGTNGLPAAAIAADTGLAIVRGNTCQNGGSTTTAVLDAGASAVDSFYVGDSIKFTAGTGAGYTRVITAYVGATKTATFAPVIVGSPDNTSVFVIRSESQPNGVQGNVSGGVTGNIGGVDAGGIVAASFGPGAIDAAAIAADAIDADALAANAVTEIQSGLASQASVDDLPTNAELATALAGADDAVLAAIAALNNLSAATVLTQMNTALDTAISELGVAAPTATPTMRTGLMLVYMMARNLVTVTATLKTISNNAGTTIASKVLSDNGTTYSEAEMS